MFRYFFFFFSKYNHHFDMFTFDLYTEWSCERIYPICIWVKLGCPHLVTRFNDKLWNCIQLCPLYWIECNDSAVLCPLHKDDISNLENLLFWDMPDIMPRYMYVYVLNSCNSKSSSLRYCCSRMVQYSSQLNKCSELTDFELLYVITSHICV